MVDVRSVIPGTYNGLSTDFDFTIPKGAARMTTVMKNFHEQVQGGQNPIIVRNDINQQLDADASLHRHRTHEIADIGLARVVNDEFCAFYSGDQKQIDQANRSIQEAVEEFDL